MKYWIYGIHAVRHALKNPARHYHKLYVTKDLATHLAEDLKHIPSAKIIITTREDITKQLPASTVHQNIALTVEELDTPDLKNMTWPESACVVVLDQVTDPHNIGAILRSAAAFGAAALVTTHHHASNALGTVAKSASGAMEYVPWIQVSNLARGLDTLKEAGFWCYGLSEKGKDSLSTQQFSGRVALILGSEGDGMRSLTLKQCDFLVRLPTAENFSTLNVSNAAAVALYEIHKQQGKI